MTRRFTATNQRVAAAKDFVLQSFRTACLAHRLDETEAATVLAKLILEVGIDPADAALHPQKAPELWSERTGRKENPLQFITRVYKPWFKRGLRRSHLLTLDPPLYTALGVWLHRHPEAKLPTACRIGDKALAMLADDKAPSERQAVSRMPHARFRVRRRLPGQRLQP
jgi:hypothetical protein